LAKTGLFLYVLARPAGSKLWLRLCCSVLQ